MTTLTVRTTAATPTIQIICNQQGLWYISRDGRTQPSSHRQVAALFGPIVASVAAGNPCRWIGVELD